MYNLHLGDGDSKSYKVVCEADPYGKLTKKLECIGHIQKRVGRKLRNLKDDGLFKDIYDDNGNKKKKKPQRLHLTVICFVQEQRCLGVNTRLI